MRKESGWFVLTGRPCSGITTTARALGYRVIPEAARTVIDEGLAGGGTVAEIRGNDEWFQHEILRRKLEVERALAGDGAPTLFDRALPDSVVYFEIAGLDPGEVRALCRPGSYERVFFLEPLPFQPDYARTEDETTLQRLERGLWAVYTGLGYPVVRVPAAPLGKRVELIRREIGPVRR